MITEMGEDGFLGEVIITSTNPGWKPTEDFLDGRPDLEMLAGEFALMVQFRNQLPWLSGDMINFMHLSYGDENTINEIIEQLVGVEDGVKKYLNYAWVARVFPIEERVYNLRWSHYRYAAGVADVKLRRQLLEEAEKSHMTTAEFHRLCKSETERIGQPEPKLEFIEDNTEASGNEDGDYDDNPPPLEDFGDARPFDIVNVTVSVTPTVHLKVEAVAKRKNLSFSDVVMVALSAYLEQEDE